MERQAAKGEKMKRIFNTGMTAIFLSLFLFLGYTKTATAQMPDNPAQTTDKKPGADTSQDTKEQSSVTQHSIRIDGQTIAYKATAGTIILKDAKGDPTGSMFYVAYTKSDVDDLGRRPVAFFYNGGPGSSTIWLHMGAYGPKRVATVDAAPTPPAPYKLVDNEDTLLGVTDEVFIDAMGTGFSHALGKAQNKDFWGVDQDVQAFAQFITAYITENNRWNSPKFLIGESYGTFRSAALGNYLQSRDNVDLNGIVLMSSVLDLGTISFYPGEDLAYVLYVPSYAATACYHKVMSCPSDLDGFLEQARQFAQTEYADALLKGSKLSEAERDSVAKKLSQFTGLSEDYILKADLRVSLPQFMEELQRAKGLTTGRLDSRFSGDSIDLLAEYASGDPQSAALSSAYTAAFNQYVREDLKFGQGMTYAVSANFAGASWDWKHNQGRGFGFPGAPNVEPDLVQALVSNPHLYVEVENGIYDLATPFFETEYTMDHLDLPANLRSHIQLKYYDAGHMMYVSPSAHAKLKANVSAFIENCLKEQE
jgi:carboxypeptidase C (cathepsin A)